MMCGAERAKAHVLVSTDPGLRVAESTGFPADQALNTPLNNGRHS